MARFRLTVEVRPAAAPARGPLRRPARPSRLGALGRRIGAVDLPVRRIGAAALVAVAILAVTGEWDYAQPVPAAAAALSGPGRYAVPGPAPSVPWPQVGSAAIGASGLGLIATSGSVAPAPTASLAKVATALVVLDDRPLGLGELGPTLVLTDQDVAAYTSDAAQQQSVVPVAAGERLSEYQALEALLIPSGNNIAETLARWDAGSVSAFVGRMNDLATQLHLAQTTFADPAGVSVQTVSTPTDMLTLGMAAMRQAVLAEIVNLPQTTLPVAGTVYNVNGALGRAGIIGIKTGSGLNLGANFLFAAAATVGEEQVTLVGCLMGLPTLDAAFSAAEALIAAMKVGITVRQVVAPGGSVGVYATGWGSRSDLIATAGVTLVEWPGMTVTQSLDSPALSVAGFVPAGTPAGQLQITLGGQHVTVRLITGNALVPPNAIWRLWRISLG